MKITRTNGGQNGAQAMYEFDENNKELNKTGTR